VRCKTNTFSCRRIQIYEICRFSSTCNDIPFCNNRINLKCKTCNNCSVVLKVITESAGSSEFTHADSELLHEKVKVCQTMRQRSLARRSKSLTDCVTFSFHVKCQVPTALEMFVTVHFVATVVLKQSGNFCFVTIV